MDESTASVSSLTVDVIDVWPTMVHLIVMLFRGLRQQQHSHPRRTRQTRQVAAEGNLLLIIDLLSSLIPYSDGFDSLDK